jgi:dTDP-glucose 4,6-dehydratase
VGTLLITGGAGFIGANFAQFWVKAHPADQVVVLDALTYAGNLASLAAIAGNDSFCFIRGDVCDEELVEGLLRERGVTAVVHFAAETHVDRSIHGPGEFLRTNVLGTHALLKAARRVWIDGGAPADAVRFHHVSTDEVYGSLGPSDPPFTERTRYSPNSPYAASKAAADHLVRAYCQTYGLPVTTSNCSNNYGPYQFPEKLIPLILVNALDGHPLPIYGDGENVRDWLYVIDHCRAVERVLVQGRPGETYNVGGQNQCRNIDLVRLLCALIDQAFRDRPELRRRFLACPAAQGRPAASLITFVKDRQGHDRRYAVDATKLERELGFVPEEDFESGLQKTLTWYLENEPWWRGVMDGSYRDWVRRQYQGSVLGGGTAAALPLSD